MKPLPEDHPASESPGSLPQAYFDELYGRAPDGDPWQFRVSPYEAAKYAATLQRLPRARYGSTLEVGCSIGVFTHQLAEQVDELLAVDLASNALAQASHLCRDQPHVRFQLMDLLAEVPAGPFDLIVVAEVAYYWTVADFDRLFDELVRALGPHGQIILVHWRGAVPDYLQTGDDVHTRAATQADRLDLLHVGHWVDPAYRTDLWERPGPVKLAEPG